MSELSRRALVTSAAALPALAMPALLPTDTAAAPQLDSREAMVARAKQISDLLGTCYIRKGWSFDKARAAAILESICRLDDEDGDGEHFQAVRDWTYDHGQSLDWLLFGDPSGMITGSAALCASTTGKHDPIYGAIEAYVAANAASDAKYDEFGGGRTPFSKEQDAELDRLICACAAAATVLQDTEPTTREGAMALLRFAAELEEEAGGAPEGEVQDLRRLAYFSRRNAAGLAGLVRL